MNAYLSKSNRAYLDDVLMARKYLIDHGYNILEYTGGAYDPGLIDRSEVVIVVPAREKQEENFVHLGRGLCSEIERAFDKGIPILVFRNGKYWKIKKESKVENEEGDWLFDFCYYPLLETL